MIGTPLFSRSAWILARARYSLGFSVLLVLSPWIGLATALGALTQEAALWLAASVGVLALAAAFLVPLAVLASRYWILQYELRKALVRLPADSNTCMVGAGGGSNIVIGMLLKMWDQLHPGEEPPSSVCTSLYIEGPTRRLLPDLYAHSAIVDKQKVPVSYTHLRAHET